MSAPTTKQINTPGYALFGFGDDLSRGPLWPDPCVGAFSWNAPGNIQCDRLPRVYRGENLSQAFYDDAPACYGEEFSRDASSKYSGSRGVHLGHVYTLMSDTRVIECSSDELESFGRLDRFASSVHDVTSEEQDSDQKE